MKLEVMLPLRLVSEQNRHKGWRDRYERSTIHRSTARNILLPMLRLSPLFDRIGEGAHLVVTITRVAPRELDDDNLVGSAKHVRDGVADALGINDRDPRVKWCYAQRKGFPKSYSCDVCIEVATSRAKGVV